MRNRRDRRHVLAFALQLLAGILIADDLAPGAPPARAASAVTIGGPFTLVAHDGSTVTDQTYRGQWLLVFFGFTFCPNTCPAALLEVTGALEALGADAGKVQPLFITVDPQRDTPAVLADYVGSFHPRIVGLTGTAHQIAAVAKDYGVYYAPHRTGPGDYVMDHSGYVYLMDGRGTFVRAFDADTPGHRIADAIRASWLAQASHRD